MIFLKKCWDWCVKHWKLTLALIGSGIAFVVGYTRANRNAQRVKVDLELKEKDFELAKENNEQFHKEAVKSVLDFEKKKLELKLAHNKKLKEAAKKKSDTRKEILNSDEKLDKILKDEWGLKKE
tara:strand:- start:214 stop:585 length:372 start_codon:yes stop_codon:yes gene_type:complete